ncbi:hypothetical protein [Bradyrhizobium sp. 187]|uniref:hypothetical protein n=1 Tax=Bradyrhizobium sp. 187 TaxID=2782655 RepID=UPI001FFF3C57|nr:hypothetical protein [Bradyrhizobium sp. 187]UPJ76911.1 hypothetical protein IVB19_39275 [Bradyrhizobium sp. 187]
MPNIVVTISAPLLLLSRCDRQKRNAGLAVQQSADDSAAQPGTSQLLGVVRESSTRSDAPQAIGTHEA